MSGRGRSPTYPWLMWQIVKSNIDVARIILQREPSISPTMFLVEAGQKTELGHVIYANSITLTPGTITVDVIDGKLEIHALTKEAAAELETGEMDRRVTRMEGAPDTDTVEDARLMFIAATLAILVTMALALIRAILGPTIYDRIPRRQFVRQRNRSS